MLIIGCDYHPGFQQIACVDAESGELWEHRLLHRDQAEQFYRKLQGQNRKVRLGMESSGHSRWFERLLHELGIELWIGDPAEIRSKRVRKQKTDRQDAQLLLRLMLENRFPRIWVPDAENRDLRQLLWHRHRLVQMRTRVMNQLHVVPLNEGLRRKKALWRPAGRKELESIALAPWASPSDSKRAQVGNAHIMALPYEWMQKYARKPPDTADIVRDQDFSPTILNGSQYCMIYDPLLSRSSTAVSSFSKD